MLDKRMFTVAYLSSLFMSLGFITFLSSSLTVYILAVAFLTGTFDATYTTLYSTVLQKTENHIRGRIFGVGMLLKSIGFALGFVVAPLIMNALDMNQMVWILHGTFILATVTALILSTVFKTKHREIRVAREI
jgi:MFS family permease